MSTVFGASFLAGAVLAFGINRVLDVHVTQAQPQVECEPIFVALRSMPQGTPVTIWDVALRDWPKAMLPTTALKAHDSFAGTVLKYPLREGQPLLSVQLVRDTSTAPPTVVAEAAPQAAPMPDAIAAVPAADAWTPVLADPVPPIAAEAAPAAEVEAVAPPVTAVESAAAEAAPVVEQAAAPTTATPDVPMEGYDEAEVTDLPATIVVAPATPLPAPTTSAEAEPSLTPVAAPTPVGEPTLAVEPTPSVEPTAAPEPTPAGEPTLADTGSLPFAAPVPALPPTDIGGALAEVSAPRSRLTESPAAAPSTDSVLADATATAASVPKRYLVVPERIALQADASFVEQPPAPPQPEPAPAAGTAERSTSRAATAGARTTGTSARSPSTAGTPKRPATQTRETAPAEKKPTPRGGGWFSGSPQAWGGIGAALRRPQADQAPGPR